MTMKLFDVTQSLNCRKVRVAARELGLMLELVPVDLATARPGEYLEKNPTGKVPTLVDDDGFVLWESGAILVHLAEKAPGAGLWPAAPGHRADVLRWMFFAANHLQPWISLLGVERVIKARSGLPPDAAAVALAERELERFLPVLDAHLDGRDCVSVSYSIADIAVGCGLLDCERRGVDLGRYRHLGAWLERLRARPAWRE